MAPIEGPNVRSTFLTSCLTVIFGLNYLRKAVVEKLIMDLVGLKETSERIAKANKVRLYGHMKKDNNDMLRALDFEVIGRGREEPMMIWRR